MDGWNSLSLLYNDLNIALLFYFFFFTLSSMFLADFFKSKYVIFSHVSYRLDNNSSFLSNVACVNLFIGQNIWRTTYIFLNI